MGRDEKSVKKDKLRRTKKDNMSSKTAKKKASSISEKYAKNNNKENTYRVKTNLPSSSFEFL